MTEPQGEDTLDLEVTADAGGSASPEAPPYTAPYDPARALDGVRARIAGRLLCILSGTIAIVFALVASKEWLGLQVDDVSKIALPIFSALITLVGTSVGFYFGGKSDHDGRRR